MVSMPVCLNSWGTTALSNDLSTNEGAVQISVVLYRGEQQMRVGVDVVDIARIVRTIERAPSFLSRVYTERELQLADGCKGSRRNELLAGRFAAKEAALKALQVGIGELSWLKEVEVLHGLNGSPKLELSGSIAELAAQNGWSDCQVSISHEAGLATAFVLLS
jgi:holo-[acyl-carrier protein] synthase